MRFTAQIQLRWGDMDALGHVNNAEFLRYLEEARVRFLADLDPVAEHGLLAARHEIDYRRPLTYRLDPIDVVMWVDRIGDASFTFAAQVTSDGVIYAEAKTVVVSIDPATGRSVRVPEPLRELLSQYRAG